MRAAWLALLAGCTGSPTSVPSAVPSLAPASQPAEPLPLPDHRGVLGAQALTLSSSQALLAIEVVPAPYFTDLVVFRTADAGRSWTRTLDGAEGTVVQWYAVDAQHVWLVSQIERAGLTPQIHRSTDGGATWQDVSAGPPGGSMVRLSDLRFRDATSGAVRHSGAGWLVTDDGGASWTVAGQDLPQELRDLPQRAAPADTVRVRSADGAFVVERRDGGSWSIVQELARYEP